MITRAQLQGSEDNSIRTILLEREVQHCIENRSLKKL